MNKNLTLEQKKVLLKEGTEKPGSSPLNHEKREGNYHCIGCGTRLFVSKKKYGAICCKVAIPAVGSGFCQELARRCTGLPTRIT